MSSDSPSAPVSRTELLRFAWLSVAAAIVTITLKTVSWQLTGSVGLLSDAIESCVNLFAAGMAVYVLRIAARPADEEHAYGHAKAEYFAAGIEGALILVAAAAILWVSIPRLVDPVTVDHVGLGLVVTALAAAINLVVGRVLVNAGRRHSSITLEADGRHLLTDVWTSVGVIVAVGAVALTGWERLDPMIAIIVAGNIVIAGMQLIRRSTGGLMDHALPAAELDLIRRILDAARADGAEYHALRTRVSGHHSFMSVHILVPGAWSVQRGHDLLEAIERRIIEAIPGMTVFTHLEPIEDPTSFEDTELVPERTLDPS